MRQEKVYAELRAVFRVKDIATDEWVVVDEVERLVYCHEIEDKDLIEADIETGFINKYLPYKFELVDMGGDFGVWGHDWQRQTYKSDWNKLSEEVEIEVEGKKVRFKEYETVFYYNYLYECEEV